MEDIYRTVRYEQISNRCFPEDYVDNVICGDCISVMSDIPEDSIDIIITSPPYFVQKAYEKSWTIDQYYRLMRDCFVQCFRILKPGRYAVFNFGDYFNGNRFYEADVPSVYPAAINYFKWGRDAGFDLQATRIWRKQFSRMGIPMICNKHPRPTFDYEHIWTYRKPDGTGQEFMNDRKKSQKAVLGDHWTKSGKISSHEASFPIDLPIWAIEVYSKDEQEIVLDPFLGIGTTLFATEVTNRRGIGIELNDEYCKMAYNGIQGTPVRKNKTGKSKK